MNDVAPRQTRAKTAASAQYLTFVVHDEHYGVEILRVQEIRGWAPTTPIPNAPAHLLGVMNLRGVIVPVVDPRVRFGLAPCEHGKFTVVVVVNLGARVVGLVVDAVSDVVEIAAEKIAPPPDMSIRAGAAFVRGVAETGDHLVVMLDLEGVVSTIEGAGDRNGKDQGAR